MQYADIDWNSLWQQTRRQKSWKKKTKTDWDKRAASFAKRNSDSVYADRFIELMKPQPHWRVLDIGCGPGTIALPLASKVQSITAIDFSRAMLDELEKRQDQKKISNISALQACWTDDWEKLTIPAHEVTISSRSLSVFDLKAALIKMDSWATEKIFIADRVGSGPFDPDLFAALNRPFDPGPDYIFTVNLLYQMGIHPSIDYIEFDKVKSFSSREHAINSCRWMLDDLTSEEEKNLAVYVDERLEQTDGELYLLHRRLPIKWAFISWEKTPVKTDSEKTRTTAENWKNNE